METKTELIDKNISLKWVFDGDGEWHAVSMVMDPDMVDFPDDQWCQEWCLQWRVVVLEDGSFFAGESDPLLLEDKQIRTRSFTSLSDLQSRIDLAEDNLRVDGVFNDGRPIHLLPVAKYRT